MNPGYLVAVFIELQNEWYKYSKFYANIIS